MRNFFFKNLHKIGYRYFSLNNPSLGTNILSKLLKPILIHLTKVQKLIKKV